MNSKISAQILYSSFVLLLIIVESLQTPISEEKRASHKLMRFGRASPHQLIHFGKRGYLNGEEDALVNDVSNDLTNDAANDSDQRRMMLLKMLFGMNQPSDDQPDDFESGNLGGISRRSARPLARKFLLQRKDGLADREHRFMHFG